MNTCRTHTLSISEAVFFMFSVGGKRTERRWVDESMAKSNTNLLHFLLCTANFIVWNSAYKTKDSRWQSICHIFCS